MRCLEDNQLLVRVPPERRQMAYNVCGWAREVKKLLELGYASSVHK